MVGNEAYKQSLNFITNATINIKTVLAQGHEDQMTTLFKKTLEAPLKLSKSKAIMSGL